MGIHSVTDSADFGARLMRQSVEQARTVPTTPDRHSLSPFAVQAELSKRTGVMTQALSDSIHLSVGLEPAPVQTSPAMVIARLRGIAEQAQQRAIDPEHCYDDSVEHAVNETLIWLNEPPSSTWVSGKPSMEDILRECLSRFLAHQARPVIRQQPARPVYVYVGPCRICSGEIERDEQGVSACNNCGRVQKPGGAR